ncbi:glycosyltransferase family 9 protein [Burkholderiaceae bacterium DAT-1]|nr:glycosyltransferase family 9 protein [Burkholderiaceae bacterium DAT-1]
MSRSTGRLISIGLALLRTPFSWPRRKPSSPKRILVLHHLLLGDSIMLTGLLASLRARFPDAELAMAMPAGLVPLYQHRPYGVEPLPFNPRDAATIRALITRPSPDWVLIPAENRYSWLARAMGARWITAFAGDQPAWKNWMVDECLPCPDTPMAWGDWAATMADHDARPVFHPDHWPAPTAAPFKQPVAPYVVIHIGSSSPLRRWEPEKWRTLAAHCESLGLEIALSCGPNERELAAAVDPEGRMHHFAGNLSLAQLWQLLAQARIVISLDTGVAHLVHLTGTPSVIIYGPGSPVLFSGGEFWRDHPEIKVALPDYACRDENIIFMRHIPWAGHCGRTLKACQSPRCMIDLPVQSAIDAVHTLLSQTST